MNLESLGFSDWTRESLKKCEQPDMDLARVLTVDRDQFMIIGEHGEMPAEVTGKIMFAAESRIDFPAVGDWVLVTLFDDATHAIINEVVPRRSLLSRKTAGKKVDVQPIAANIDIAFIVQSLDGDYNLNRMERYMVMVLEEKIEPVILLSKADALPHTEVLDKIKAIRERHGDLKVISYSAVTGEGLKQITELFTVGRTACLLGSSGVGKTTLLNRLLDKEAFATKEVRDFDQKGRHTTTRRQLIVLEDGGLIIDTPGMRELGNFGIEEGLEETFSEIHRLAEKCRFKDCTHTHEAGCAVLESVDSGELDSALFESYSKLQKENAYLQRSYLEKRQRDKAFGKMVKTVKKHKKLNG